MNAQWRQHPRLLGRFHPEAPDDLQVIVHRGGPRTSTTTPELVWVTVTGIDDDDLCRGRLLNQPHSIPDLARGSTIDFLPTNGEHALMVSQEYLGERADWIIHPCSGCGLDELLDPPSKLIAVVFPDLPPDAGLEAFTAICGACGGSQLVTDANAATSVSEGKVAQPVKRWWQFWE